MAGGRCTCGFTEVAGEDYTFVDHLLEMFSPEDCLATDGTEHTEGQESFRCLCGTGGSQESLDAHFLQVFTPIDAVGVDRIEHRMIAL